MSSGFLLGDSGFCLDKITHTYAVYLKQDGAIYLGILSSIKVKQVLMCNFEKMLFTLIFR